MLRDRHDLGDVANSYHNLVKLCSTRSSKHQIDLYVHADLGKILVLNDEVQHVEAWAPLYHEPLVHLPSAFIPDFRTALILGGGSFYAAAEVLKYESVERVVMLDYDPSVMKICQEHYPHARAASQDDRLEIRVSDIHEGVYSISGQFDLIVNDSVDMMNPEREKLFDRLESLCSPTGVCADVLYRHVFQGSHCRESLLYLTDRSCHIACSLLFVPEYPGILHLLTLWGTTERLTQDLNSTLNGEQQRWCSGEQSCPCVYFHPRHLPYFLYLPPYLRQKITVG